MVVCAHNSKPNTLSIAQADAAISVDVPLRRLQESIDWVGGNAFVLYSGLVEDVNGVVDLKVSFPPFALGAEALGKSTK